MERVKHYRLQAELAERAAAECLGDARRRFLELAVQWRDLARQSGEKPEVGATDQHPRLRVRRG